MLALPLSSAGEPRPPAGGREAPPPELAAAFAAFNETSALLQQSYAELQERVGVLSHELSEARSARLAQLAETERLASRLSSLLAALPGAVVVLDGEGTICDHNDGASALFGTPLTGRAWSTALHDIEASTTDGGGELLLADGRRLSVSARPLDGEAGRIILLTDVTETRRLQGLLERQNRLSAMGEVMARLAHQTRTPLATAILYASQLRRSDLEPAAATFTTRLLARLHHLEGMIEDMLCFARGSDGGSTLIEIGALLREAVQDLEAGGHAARVTTVAPARPLYVRGNRQALGAAIGNVVANALQFAEVGRVVVEASGDGDAVDVRVRDDGPGIAPELHERIFDPFFTTRSSGTGLGLAVVRSVAEGHGGEVRVEASSADGTTFHLRLPQADVEAGAAEPARRHGHAR